MPSYPVMMMVADPIRMMVIPPGAVVPHMSFVIVAIVGAPIWICRDPVAMVIPHPIRMIVIPPVRVVPFVVRVPLSVMVRMSHHRRSREQGCQSCRGEKSSKFHSDYLLQ